MVPVEGPPNFPASLVVGRATYGCRRPSRRICELGRCLNRDDPSAAPLLHAIAYECAFMCINLGVAFHLRVELPPWVHSQLARLKDVTAELNDRYKPDRAAAR